MDQAIYGSRDIIDLVFTCLQTKTVPTAIARRFSSVLSWCCFSLLIPLSARPIHLKMSPGAGLSLGRQTITNVLLQEQAEPASAPSAPWLSGICFPLHHGDEHGPR